VTEHIYLSRRNLLTLLSKLDRRAAGEATKATLIKFQNKGDPYVQSMDSCKVTAVEDDEYYTAREPGGVLEVDEP
jgi:hypothetical protein